MANRPRRPWYSLAELVLGLTLNAAAILAAAALIDPLPSANAAPAPSTPPAPAPAPSTPAPPATPAPPSPSPPAIASYTLDARLDPATRSISGQGTITWLNSARVPTSELYFHLYLNAFKSLDSLFNRSPFVRARGDRKPSGFGSITLKRLVARELGEADLLAGAERHTPGDPADETDLRIALPRAIQPGEQLTLDVAWESVLPELIARTGASRDFYVAGQWFPKLARLEPGGDWAHFAFHPLSEFYADFGSYDVTLDVPAEMVVGATGVRVKEAQAAGRSRLEYRAENVHDFAWAAWSGFLERSEDIEGIAVRLLYPRGHEQNAERTLAALRFALPHFNARYGVYPYPVLTVVHPPSYAQEAGGMEYPTLITTGGPWHQSYWSRLMETVTIHELGHQWFYGLLASDERRWPFLDEGLNSYAESVATEAMFGASSGAKLGSFELAADAARRALLAPYQHDAAIARAASEFSDFNQLGALVYNRCALLFKTLARVYGAAELDRALARYAERERFGHPEPESLLQILAEVLGEQAASNARSALFDGASVDYAVRDLRAVRLPPEAGGDATASGAGTPPQFLSRFRVTRDGALTFPVEIVFETLAGEALHERWSGAERTRLFEHRGPSPVVSVRLDPELAVLLDDDLLNNAVRSEPRTLAHGFERVVFGVELLLGVLGP